MAFTQPILFKDTSDLDIDPSIRIISLSDIHGDIDALIIALRDCANVIKPRSNLPDRDNNVRDPLLDRLLKLDLKNRIDMDEFNSNTDLGFDWIGINTHVVLIGDTIDPVRKSQVVDTTTGKIQSLSLETAASNEPNQRNVNDVYPQIEIKILKFLNKLDEVANIYGGRVIKLIGNHEIDNFRKFVSVGLHNDMTYYSNIYTHDGLEEMPYLDDQGVLRTMPRNKYFNLNNPGFKLFMERGSGIFLRINNNLFMHGQLYDNSKSDLNIFDYTHCDRINKWLNSGTNLLDAEFNAFNLYKPPQLWGREYGDDQKINKRMISKTESDKFCERVKGDKEQFLFNHPKYNRSNKQFDGYKVESMRIIIGHCPQSDSTIYYGEINRTFTTQQNRGDNKTVMLSAPAINTIANFQTNTVFGISMECPNPANDHHQIYKVDVSSSRGFDRTKVYNMIVNDDTMKQYLLSRVPQVLEIRDRDVSIIRSTLKNTRIHQYRADFENLLNEKIKKSYVSPNLYNDNIAYGGYKEKYLKYKEKYLKLKKIINQQKYLKLKKIINQQK